MFINKAFKINSTILLMGNCIFLAVNGCGTATSEGYCKQVKASAYVAATQDVDGKEWKLSILEAGEQNSLTITCPVSSTPITGNGEFTVKITDAQKIPKPGVIVSTSDTKFPGFLIDTKNSDINTDSCGIAKILYSYSCPKASGQKNSGTVTIYSGALAQIVEVTIKTDEPTTTN